ncbi:hypothetical protein T4D_4618 [Trichinella pseudospiralis]|uniref:Uncharacterized protein n=1 Tax=Trichinella pseudospiralis TaxID=6337 RepID=A0A0V1G0A9_TRIPS|nr:hypothetical protein T4D_4618 [Trichinella pseudospiralis]
MCKKCTELTSAVLYDEIKHSYLLINHLALLWKGKDFDNLRFFQAYQQSMVDDRFFEFNACSSLEMFTVTDRITADDIPGVLPYFLPAAEPFPSITTIPGQWLTTESDE